MTLPASGPISTDMILNELRVNNPARAYPLNTLDADVLALIGKSGPPVVMPNDFYGKGAVGPLTVTGVNASRSADSSGSAGSVSCSPSVIVAGGNGTKSYAWSFLSNPGGCTLTNATSQTCMVSRSYAQNAIGSATASLRCVVTDTSGSKAVDGITASLEWNPNL